MAEPAAWVPITSTWVRHLPDGIAPLATSKRAQGRFHRTGTPTVYLAEDEATMWAEWYRALAEQATLPDEALPRLLWRYEVELERVADLTGAGALAATGLPLPEPTREQWPVYQAVGERLQAAGAEGVLYPSAARSDSRCLCVFAAGHEKLRPAAKPSRFERPPHVPRGLRT